ncbi:MAG: D-aminoacylase [Proteobacteria bacterium]|nr:D-aminoacylase [Pseudomonadota bacterium]
MSAACALVVALVASACASTADREPFDVVVRGGSIYDGSGGAPFAGDLGVRGDRIAYVGPRAPGRGRSEIDARGKAVSPGFINMLSWANETLLVHPEAESDLRQGVTLEVFGEGWSMGPWTEEMKRRELQRQGDIKFDVAWTTLDEYLRHLERRGVSPNVASFVGATTVRMHELGEGDVDPTPEQLARMRALVRRAMEDGALGVGSSLIYAPAFFAETPELTALAGEAAMCGGIYISHIRNESTRLVEAVDELIAISRASGAPAEIYHLKQSGRSNWGKLDEVIARVEDARRSGLRITADMYTYPASSTGLDASMPLWVQEGGLEAWVARLKTPETRARVIKEMREQGRLREAGPEGVLLVGFKTAGLKPLVGRTLAQVAKERGVSPEEAAVDLVAEDGSRVDVIYFTMSEDNVRRQTALPWMSFGSDAGAREPEGVFLQSSTHPRAYGNFARLLGKYVREEKTTTLQDAVRRLTSLPASNLGLKDRGALKPGFFADVVVFDPASIKDNATFEKPQQFATGVSHVLVNGALTLSDGEPTGQRAGRVVRGRGWRGWPDGGCRASARDWAW